ncbi:hypothetical protein [Natronogracilivirga saccharolytica]|uniref:DUF4270 family protein n=1 Tax=Natronogracilivirga saccharolytica TaxID=2812953 RepID=A0A8J7RHY0_9BACT|nr:hypothetical protein [Natronogracilivirga saccharolytica]MBP3191527.1 hypothetical protein [Natronogracilivirga saccharolytica]
MQTFDGISNRLTLSLALLLTIWIFSGCDDTPVVGGDLSPDDASVKADTVLLDDTSIISTPSFSGNRQYVTTGSVDDPAIGQLFATAMLRPSIDREEGADSIGPGAAASIALSPDYFYGMEAEPASYHIVEIERRWRSSSWRYDSIPELGHSVVAEFTLTDSDSIVVPLDQQWADKYREIFMTESDAVRDSLYEAEMHGLAIVPADDNGKMFSFEPSQAELLFETADGEGGISQEFRRWAVSLEKDLTFSNDADGSRLVFNTMRHMLELDIEFTEEFLGTNNFSRVELVMYKDTVSMQQDVPSTFLRPGSETMRVYQLEDEQLDFAITADPTFQSNIRSEDNSFRFNLTNLVNERLHLNSDSRKLYGVIGANDGRVFPHIISGKNDPGRSPKLLITSFSKDQ